MGRPLKIKKSTTINIGFNDFGNVEVPVIPTGMTTTEFLGVVGGANAGIATSAYPVVDIYANVNGQAGNGYIIRQKGASKYLATPNNTVSAGSLTVGFSYVIKALGNTNWAAVGAAPNAAVGDVFVCTAAGSGSGTASDVGQVLLVNSGSPQAGQASISFNTGAGNVYASKMTNKYVWDYSTPATRYAADFFVDGPATNIVLANVNIANTAGQFTASSAALSLGQAINVSGTAAANTTGTISGYSNPSTYYVIATNGSTSFTLSAAEGGSALTTGAGNTVGWTFSVDGSGTVKSGADIATWTNGTGNLQLGLVQNYTS
jgi:hypothetical protein